MPRRCIHPLFHPTNFFFFFCLLCNSICASSPHSLQLPLNSVSFTTIFIQLLHSLLSHSPDECLFSLFSKLHLSFPVTLFPLNFKLCHYFYLALSLLLVLLFLILIKLSFFYTVHLSTLSSFLFLFSTSPFLNST